MNKDNCQDHLKKAKNTTNSDAPETKLPWQAARNLPINLSAQAYYISKLSQSGGGLRIIWGLNSNRELAPAATLLKFFQQFLKSPGAVLTFPQDFLTWQASRPPEPSTLLVAREHWPLALPNGTSIKQHTINLKTGSTLKPAQLKTALAAAGYEAGPLPERDGWWQQQGGTLWLAAADATWQLVWQGNQLETINRYNLLTQNIFESVKTLIIHPRQLPPQNNSSLNNHLTAADIIINPPLGLKLLSQRIITCQSTLPSALGGIPSLVNSWPQVNDYIKAQLQAGYVLKIFSTEIQNLKIKLAPWAASLAWQEISDNLALVLEGFKDDLNKTIYLSDRELIGLKRHHFITNLAAYEKLMRGDYVVHIDHGIGRFNSLISQTVDEQTRDYFLIDYADNDKLYVPIEHTDRLSRYLGSPHPPLQKLQGGNWFKITRRAKQETAALARELIKLYAERTLARVKPMAAYPEEELLAASFPWPLTSDQLKAWAEIAADLTGTKPADRLICGDVGFGKTELAVRAAFRAVLNGYQVAVLTPTTLLAQQHYDTFSQRLKNFGLNLGLLSRAQTAARQLETIKLIKQGRLDIAIGTHSLLANRLQFNRLGLLIIDEEQRFGVKQKEKLKNYKPTLHVLSLSATPIPRSLNLAVSSLRDLSLIMTPPTGRQKVNTTVSVLNENIIKQALDQEIKRGGQIYYLVNHIADLPRAAARLNKLAPQATLGIIHGRLPAAQTARIMRDFDAKKLDILLATSIIENGLDLPGVNTLVVENSEKFGLADLYQLKGRVGRGTTKAYAYFLVGKKLTDLGQKRLQALRAAEDLGSGLSLALKDMELRGAGAILGREQHGQVTAVGVHLYGQLLAQAIEELKTGLPTPTIPEVLLRLPLPGLIAQELIPDELNRLQIYRRLAAVREAQELKTLAEEILGRPLQNSWPDNQLQNLLTLLEFKLLAERAGLREVSCKQQGDSGQFLIRFLNPPTALQLKRLNSFDSNWHQVESSWQARQPLAAGAWIEWLKASLEQLVN